jgi:hypothetical protein
MLWIVLQNVKVELLALLELVINIIVDFRLEFRNDGITANFVSCLVALGHMGLLMYLFFFNIGEEKNAKLFKISSYVVYVVGYVHFWLKLLKEGFATKCSIF